MIDPAPSPAPCDASPTCALCGAQADRVARRLRVSQRLGDLGLELAEAVQARALAVARAEAAVEAGDADAGPSASDRAAVQAFGGDLSLSFNRLSKSVRLSVALEMRIEKDLNADTEVRRVRAQADQRQAEERAVAKKRNETTREDLIEGAVQVFIEAEAEEDEAEDLMNDLSDMVEDGLATKLAHLPISGAIEHLCRDLGVTPDWDEVARERWAYEEARDGVPGSPFVERRRRRARERAARALAKDRSWRPASPDLALDVIGGLPPGGAGVRDGPGWD